MIVAFDSNIFIFAFDALSPKHTTAKKLIIEASVGAYPIVLAPQIIAETYRVITRKGTQNAFSPREAVKEMEKLVDRFEMVYPNAETTTLFLDWLKKYEAEDVWTFDVFLAATFLSNGVEALYTDNDADFQPLKNDLKIINPFDN